MTVFFIRREFVGQDELIKDAGGHQNSFAGAHRQGKNVVGVGTGIRTHPLVSIIARNAPGIFTQSAPPIFTHTAPLCRGSTDWDQD